ncbi:MAG: CvpA family protein [Candidatus Levybacteria bacterium]|nr:CvpA family protein [Candidatus Levybacteria bacterium]
MANLNFLTGFNWVDGIILVVVLVYIIQGLSLGFLQSIIDFSGFVFSFIAGLKFYGLISALLTKFIAMPSGFSKALGFLIAAIISEIIISFILKTIINVAFSNPSKVPEFIKKTNSVLGIIPSVASVLVLLSFILSLIISFPFSPFLKNSVSSSKIGSVLVQKTQGFESDIQKVFGGALNETLNFLTVEPQDNSIVKLQFQTNNLKTDEVSERKMIAMVNQERVSRGLPSLDLDTNLRDAGRNHCTDMFQRGYFSHYTPEGLSPFDRMAKFDISFTYAGENLAFSPSVELAMQGLMQSPGHKANILSPNFGKIGIGVIDGGIYGEMFCQEFTD